MLDLIVFRREWYIDLHEYSVRERQPYETGEEASEENSYLHCIPERFDSKLLMMVLLGIERRYKHVKMPSIEFCCALIGSHITGYASTAH